ncbi:GNAT family N-acetyltransferase [Pendulispora albinea]|uniref:GNAT family N-acetyltransferase n=1 Tax=Pendulispora albinea TaxID=2741071 RepID=A0ABZ2LW37_9BACT
MIDLATLDDVPAILALANWAATNTTANFATGEEPLTEWIASWQATREYHPWLVARENGKVVGFAKSAPHRARGAYRWMAEVSVYVDPQRHERGLGRALYDRLLPTLRAQGYVTLLGGITSPNPASERLHAAVGFVRCGTYHRAGWKFGQWHDVGYWERHLQRADLPPQDLLPVREVWPAIHAWCTESAGLAVERVELGSKDAEDLIGGLNRELAAAYPEPGANHFRLEASEVAVSRGAFVIAYLDRRPVACGAFRTMDETSAELKRMYVVPRWRGLGISKRVLRALEEHAASLHVKRMVLETGTRQSEALALYARNGYRRIPLFGEYVGSPCSICMEKSLTA